MMRLVRSSLWARKRRLVGTCVAVVLGVAFLVGTLVLGDTLAANFDRLFTETSAGTDVVVRNSTSVVDDDPGSTRGPIPIGLLDAVEGVDGVTVAEPQVVGYGQLLGSDGDPIGGNGPPRQAASWMPDPDLNPYRLVEGRPPAAPDEVVVNRGAADTGDLAVGDTTTVQTPEPMEVTIVGIATFGDEDGLGETTFTAFDLATAQQRVLGSAELTTSILISGEDGLSDGELAERVAAVLPDGVEAITGEDVADEQLAALGFLDMIRVFLVAFAGIALVVAVLSINNTFTITVAQRTRELAVLRAVGASKRQVRRVVTLEAAVVGVISSVIGVLAGLVVAGLLKGLFDALGLSLPAGGLEIRPLSLAAGLVVGIVATMVAARAAARRASGVSPLAAMRDAAAESTAIGRRRVVAGLALAVLGAGLLVAGASGEILLVGIGSVLVLAATLTLAPLAAQPVASAIGRLLMATRGLPGRLARDNATRNPRRMSSTATALVVGVAVVSLFTVFAASLRSGIDDDVSAGFGDADLALATPVFGGGELSADAARQIADLPEVDASTSLGTAPVRLGDANELAAVSDLSTIARVLDVDVVDGDLDDPAPTDVAISESWADREDLAVGSTVDATFADGGQESLTVTAVYADQQILGGFVLDQQIRAEHTQQPTDRAVFVTTAPGTSVEDARQALAPIAQRFGGDIQDRSEYAAAATGGLDLLLSVVYALLALAIIIALLGIANTLSLAVHERRREIGLLRAVGQSRRQTRAALRLESVIVATFGTLIGLALGTVLGWALYAATTDGDVATVPVLRLAVVAVLGALAGVLAAIRPARRAARLPILDAIATT